jgi:Nif-specific regulatory protein
MANGSPMSAHVGEIRKLQSLLEVSQALSNAMELQAGLDRVLELLELHHDAARAAITLLRDGDELAIAASIGLEFADSRYRVGEGITGRVVATGQPTVVPQVSREPAFLNRAADRTGRETTFFCVPIAVDGRTIGALSVDIPYRPDLELDRMQSFLRVVASMIGQGLKVQQLVESERQRLLAENQSLRRELKERYDFQNIIGNSGPMREVFEQVAQVAPGATTVLVRGETGTGKELIAHAIHYASPRAQRPFVRVSCAALPETLIEAELFGHEKGAFTGAHSRKKGRFELAEGGTLFLDEVGELSLATQVKLLRALQEREFERLGGTETLKANVRVIAATNRSLEKAITEGAFREDLYYRLNVFSIFVPPLRDRKADVLLLANHFLARCAREHKKKIKRISTPAIDMLAAYHWPGNVRELENAIERAVVVCDGNVLHAHHLPPTLQTAEASGTTPTGSLDEQTAAFERSVISDALKATRGNKAKAARLLGTTERIVAYKMRKYAIDPARFRAAADRAEG